MGMDRMDKQEQPTTPAPIPAQSASSGASGAAQGGITIAGRHFTLPWVIGGVVAALVVLTCGCCGTVTLASALTSTGKTTAQATATSHQANTQPTQPRATATAQPQATATLAPAKGVIHAAVLGGTEIDFIQSGAAETYIFKDNRTFQGSIGGVGVVVGGALTDGAGGQRFWSLILTPLDKNTTWNAATALNIAKQLIPADAQYVKDKQVPDFGLEHIYVSKSLAASFPDAGSGLFTDVDTNTAVTPGTFYIACNNVNSVRGGCTIQTGQ